MRKDHKLFIVLMTTSWVFFQGIPSVIYKDYGFNAAHLSSSYLLNSLIALVVLIFGYLVAIKGVSEKQTPNLVDKLVTYTLPVIKIFLFLSFPFIFYKSIQFALVLNTNEYGTVQPYTKFFNIFSYITLGLLPIILWNKHFMQKNQYWLLITLIVLPRLVISMFGQRFFVLQALVPIIIWESFFYPRKISLTKIFFGLVFLFFAIFYLFPTLRKDKSTGLKNMVVGSPIFAGHYFNKYLEFENISGCKLIAGEIVSNTVGLDVFDIRNQWNIPKEVPIRIDQAATYFARIELNKEAIGTGGNPMEEAFPNGNLTFCGLIWFFIIGYVTGVVITKATSKFWVCFFLPHVSSKVLFLWRATISEFFDRLPFIMISLLVLIIVLSYATILEKKGKAYSG